MNTREFFIRCFKDEKPKFVKVFRAVPADGLAYRPHPRSSSAGDLVALLDEELREIQELLEKGASTFAPPASPASLEPLIASYEAHAAAIEKRLPALDDAAWEKKVKVTFGENPWEAPLGEMLFGYLFDAIHHRGQLSTYLRPMGGKVPSIYGPSADDPGM